MYKDKGPSYSGVYNTPLYLFNYLNKHFHFELDPCASKTNPKWLNTSNYFTCHGLEYEWNMSSVFVNPPYGLKNEELWVDKAIKEFDKYRNTIFILLPNKTEAPWYHKIFNKSTVIIFPQKRINFVRDGKTLMGNNMGSVIFGLVDKENNDDLLRSFYLYHVDLDIPRDILDENKYFFFPNRDILKREYTNDL